MAKKKFKIKAEHNLAFPLEALAEGLAGGQNVVIYVEDKVNPKGHNTAKYGAILDSGYHGSKYQFMQNVFYNDAGDIEKEMTKKLSDFITKQLKVAAKRKTKGGKKVKKPRRNKIEFEEAVNVLGVNYVKAVKDYIDNLEGDSVLGSDPSKKPLYDTGTLYNSIEYLTIKD